MPRSPRGSAVSGSSTSPTRWEPSCPRGNGPSSGSSGRRCTGRACWCWTSPPRRSTRTSRGGSARGCAPICDEYGTALLVTSHDMAEVERLCERVVFIAAGRIVADGTPAEVAERFGRTDLEGVFLHLAEDRLARTGSASARAPADRAPAMTAGTDPGADARTRADLAADARGRPPARVRAAAQPAPALRRHAVAARRRARCSARSRTTSGAGTSDRRWSGRGVPHRRDRAVARRVPVADLGQHRPARGDVEPQPAEPHGHAAARGRVRRWRRPVRHGQARDGRRRRRARRVRLLFVRRVVARHGARADRRGAAARRLDDRAVRRRDRAALRRRGRGAGVGRHVRGDAAVGDLLPGRLPARAAAAGGAGAADDARVRRAAGPRRRPRPGLVPDRDRHRRDRGLRGAGGLVRRPHAADLPTARASSPASPRPA